MAERPSFFEPIKEQAKAHAKRKRVIESDEESVEEIQLTRDMLPGLKRYEEKLNEMWARHKDDSENQDDDEDDDDYVNSSNEADCSDEEETLSDEQSTELMDSQSDDSSVELDATNKNSKPASLLHRRGFFKPLSVAVDTNREQDQRQARLN
jgi:large subunit ribosomal protein L28